MEAIDSGSFLIVSLLVMPVIIVQLAFALPSIFRGAKSAFKDWHRG